MRWIVSIALITAALWGCAGGPDPDWRGPTPVHGVVYGYAGAPVAGVTVAANDGAPVHSDVQGRFTLPQLTPGAHSITARKPGYESLTAELLITDRTEIIYLRLRSANDFAREAQRALDHGSTGEASDLIDQALLIDPESPVLRYLSAIARALGGRHQEASVILEWFRQYEPYPAVALLRDRIETEAGR